MDVFRIDDGDDDAEESEGPHQVAPEPGEHEPDGLGAFVAEHALAVLGGALAAGYVLGGGLFTPLARRVFRLGVRVGFQLALLPALERDVAGMASTLGQTLRDFAEATGRATPPRAEENRSADS